MPSFKLISIVFLYAISLQPAKSADSTSIAKQKTISLEEMLGNNRQFLQLMTTKVFVPKKKIGLLSITSYAADYQDNLSSNEIQNTTLIYHHLIHGISIHSGAVYTSIEGMNPFIGLQYQYKQKTLSFILLSMYQFNHIRKISNMAILEWKPPMHKNWSWYTQIQLHYNYDLKKENHFRSFVYGRFGFTYDYFSFGLAYNYDRYGTFMSIKSNVGVFVKLTL